MARVRRIAIVTATVVSAPGVLVAAAACLYILWSIATEAWYRDLFAGYGSMMAALYAAFVAGALALAWLAVSGARSKAAIVLAVTGFAAACALAFELYDEADRVLPFALLFGPYIAWAGAWLVLRSRPPPEPR